MSLSKISPFIHVCPGFPLPHYNPSKKLKCNHTQAQVLFPSRYEWQPGRIKINPQQSAVCAVSLYIYDSSAVFSFYRGCYQKTYSKTTFFRAPLPGFYHYIKILFGCACVGSWFFYRHKHAGLQRILLLAPPLLIVSSGLSVLDIIKELHLNASIYFILPLM